MRYKEIELNETYPGWGPYPGYGMPKTHPKHPSRKKKNEGEVNEWSDKETTAAANKDSKKVQRTGTHANRKWAVGEEREDDAPSTRTSGFTKSAGSDLQGLIKQEPANAKELKGKKRALKFKLPQTINMPFDDDEENVNTLMGSEEGAPEISDLVRMLKLAGVKSEAAGKNTGTPPTPWRHSADWIRPEGGWSKKEVNNKRDLGRNE